MQDTFVQFHFTIPQYMKLNKITKKILGYKIKAYMVKNGI